MRAMARHAYTKLSQADARALRALVGTHGFTRVARMLGAGVATIETLSSGGTARADTTERVSKAVRGVAIGVKQ